MKKILLIFSLLLSVPAFAGPAANVQYVHDALYSLRGVSLGVNASAVPSAIANMEYLLKTIDVANHHICGRAMTSHGTSTYATKNASDTDTVNNAIRNLMPVYQRVDHLIFTGDQYINTGIDQISASAEIDFQFQYTSAPVSGRDMYVFGAGVSYNKNAFFFMNPDTTMSTSSYSNRFHVRYGTTSAARGTYYNIRASDLDRHTMRLNRDRKVFFDGVQVGTTPTATAPNTARTIFLGNTSYGDYYPLSELYGYYGKVFSFKIWKTDVLTRDMIPVKNLETGVYGMLDLVSKQFFGDGRGTVPLGGAGEMSIFYTQSGDVFCE